MLADGYVTRRAEKSAPKPVIFISMDSMFVAELICRLLGNPVCLKRYLCDYG